MNKILNFNSLFLVFLTLVFFSLISGFQCQYSQVIALNHYNEEIIINPLEDVCVDFMKIYWQENGFIEMLQVIFLIISIILLINIKLKLIDFDLIHIFIVLKICVLIYYLGEEISWGQHFFGWQSPDIFFELNKQKETNLHNISNLFNELPRTLVFIWCGLLSIIINLKMFKNLLSEKLHLILLPNKKLIFISLLLLLIAIPDLLVDKFDLHPGNFDETLKHGSNSLKGIFWDKITFNFIRLSELHELIFCFYFLNYSFFLRKKLF